MSEATSNKGEGPSDLVPYVVRYNIWFRAFSVACAVFAAWLFVLAQNDQGEKIVVLVWNQNNLISRVGIVLAYIVAPAFLFEAFLEKTVFEADRVRRRNRFGKWREYAYSDVSGIDVFPGEFVRIRFSGNRTLKIYAAMADLSRIEEIIRARTSVLS